MIIIFIKKISQFRLIFQTRRCISSIELQRAHVCSAVESTLTEVHSSVCSLSGRTAICFTWELHKGLAVDLYVRVDKVCEQNAQEQRVWQSTSYSLCKSETPNYQLVPFSTYKMLNVRSVLTQRLKENNPNKFHRLNCTQQNIL